MPNRPHKLLALAMLLAALAFAGWPSTKPATAPMPEPRPQEASAAREVPEDVWAMDALGFRMHIPEGWTRIERGSRHYLQRDPCSALSGNFSAIWLPNFFGMTLDGLLEENRAELGANPDLDLDSIEITRAAGRNALRVAYHGRPHGTVEDVRFLGIVYLDRGRQIVLTACARESDWPAIETAVEASLASLERAPDR
jgi:hypothetical protein